MTKSIKALATSLSLVVAAASSYAVPPLTGHWELDEFSANGADWETPNSWGRATQDWFDTEEMESGTLGSAVFRGASGEVDVDGIMWDRSTGLTGRAIELNNGEDDHVLCLPGEVLDGAVDFTVSFWMKADENDQPGQYCAFLSSLKSSSTSNALTFQWIEGSAYHFYVDIEGNSVSWSAASTGLLDDEWHHVAVVREDQVGIKLFIDGQLISNKVPLNYNALDIDENALVFGQELDGITNGVPTWGQANQRYVGLIDDIRIYRLALKDEEVAAIHRSLEMTAWWELNESAGGIGREYVFDSGVLGHNGRRRNSKRDFRFVDGATELNGVNDMIHAPGQVLNGAVDFTVAFWMKADANDQPGTYCAILSSLKSSTSNALTFQWIEGSDYHFYVDNEGDSVSWSAASTGLLDDEWHHVAVVREDQVGIKLFIDKQFIATRTPSNYNALDIDVDTGEHALAFGQELDGMGGDGVPTFTDPDQRYVGLIDDIRIYRVALDSQTIEDIYDETKAVLPEEQLIQTAGVVISKIGFEPNGEPNYEFVELYNRTDAPVALDGWVLSTAISHTFGAGDSIPPRSILVVAKDQDEFLGTYQPPTSEEESTIVIIPDTQAQARVDNPNVFDAMTGWIKDKAGSPPYGYDIAYVSHVGDIIFGSPGGYLDTNDQWTTVMSSMSEIDGIPHLVAMGNHDTPFDEYWAGGTGLGVGIPRIHSTLACENGCDNPWDAQKDTYVDKFGPNYYSTKSWDVYFSNLADDPDERSQYTRINACNRTILHLNLEFRWLFDGHAKPVPQPEAPSTVTNWHVCADKPVPSDDPVVEWALDIIDENPDMPVIITMHNQFQLPAVLADHERVFLTLHGHKGNPISHLHSQAEQSRLLLQADFAGGGTWMGSDPQGYMFIIRFSPSESLIQVDRLSPGGEDEPDWQVEHFGEIAWDVSFDARLGALVTAEKLAQNDFTGSLADSGTETLQLKDDMNNLIWEVEYEPNSSTSPTGMIRLRNVDGLTDPEKQTNWVPVEYPFVQRD